MSAFIATSIDQTFVKLLYIRIKLYLDTCL